MTDTNPTPEAPKFGVGLPVLYINTEGHERAATIIGTHDSIEIANGRVPQPEQGYFHLVVFSFSGPMYKLDVPHEAVAQTIPDHTIEGKLVGYIKGVA